MRFLTLLAAALPLATALPNVAPFEDDDLSLAARNVQEQQQCNVGGYDGGRYQPRQVIHKKNCDAYACSTYCKQASWCRSYAIGQDSCRLYSACVSGNVKSTRFAPAYHFYDRSCPCRPAPQKPTITTSKSTTSKSTTSKSTTTKKVTTTTKSTTTTAKLTTKTTTPSTTKTTTASTTPSTTRSTTTPSTTTSTTSSTTTSRTTTTQSAYCTGAFRLQKSDEPQVSDYPYVYRSDGTEYTFGTSDTDCASFIIDNSVSGHPNLLKNVDVATYAYHTGPGTGVMDDTLNNILDNSDRQLIGGCTISTSGVISCDVPSRSFGFDGGARLAVDNENGNTPNTGSPSPSLRNYTPASIVLTALCNLPYKPPCYRGDYCFDADHQYTQVCGKRVTRPASGRISTETTINACRSGCFSDGNCDLYDFGFDGNVCTFYAQDGAGFATEADDFHTYGYFSGPCNQKR